MSAGCLVSGLPSWCWFHFDCFVFITTIHMCPPLFLLKVTVKSQPTVHCGFTEQRPPTLSSTGFSCSTRNPQCVDVEGERKATQWLRPGLPDCPIQVTPAIMFLFINWQLQLQIEMWKDTKSREKRSSCTRAERSDNCGFKMTKDESQMNNPTSDGRTLLLDSLNFLSFSKWLREK